MEQLPSAPPARASEQLPDYILSIQNLTYEPTSMKVKAAVHNERQNSRDDLKTNEDTKMEQGEFSHFKQNSTKDHEMVRSVESNRIPDYNIQKSGGTGIVRTSATDHQMASGSGLSTAEVAVALLGASASTQSMNNNIALRANCKHRRGATFQEEDLSSAYNHYRCLSPSDQHINNNYIRPHHGSGGSTQACTRFLRRQFSLDRGDEPSVFVLSGSSSVSTMTLDSVPSVGTPRAASTGRLFKQNSAGAATDLERIEEIPLVNTVRAASPRPGSSRNASNGHYLKQRFELEPFSSSSISVSMESLK